MTHPRLPYAGRGHADPRPGAPALEAHGLTYVYPGASREAIADLRLAVERGSRAALIGHNGSGKSTFLKLAAGLQAPTAGDVRVFGNRVGACHHRVAFLPQRSEIDWSFPITVERLVLGGRYVHCGWLRRPGRHDRAMAADALEQLGLLPLRERQIGALSGGQQQRALLARALAQEAELLLLDEPLNAVDQTTRATVASVLEGLARRGRTLVVATHDRDLVAGDFDEVVELRDGRMLPSAAAGVASEELVWTG
ncbi:MAG: ATP-binding cassette domain-containing protein [Actinobacteria bacterium]|nr:ATP-binding cassette domain-containing protein [Actinomycetota bacterium]